MKIVEEFDTLQGEGKYLGVPSHFIRTTGCNLRCSWIDKDGTITTCDTPYTSFKPEAGKDLDINKTLKKLKETKIRHIVITGGEPTLQGDLLQTVNIFRDQGYQVTIESNGTRYIEGLKAFMSFSPKLRSSYHQTGELEKKLHERNNKFLESLSSYVEENGEYQLKFVVNEEKDFDEIFEIQRYLLIPNDNIYIMPQGISGKHFLEKAEWIFNECIKRGYNYTPRLHIDIFGNKRGI